MARAKKTIRVCDRCAFGAETVAAETRSFTVHEQAYEIDLCDKHAAQFDRELAGWARLAAEVDAPVLHKSEYFTKERQQETKRLRELMGETSKAAVVKSLAEARAAEIDTEIELDREQLAWRSVPGALAWTMTTHARERMGQRGFTLREVLRTVTHATHTHRQPWRGPGIAIHYRGDCRVVVDDSDKTIITVIDRSAKVELEPPAQPDQPPHPLTPMERTAL